VNKETDFRDWWQTIYEEIFKRQGKGKKIEGKPSLLFKGVGVRIREARIDREMSQEDLALTVGMK